MTDAELLAFVKKGLGITGTYQDDTLGVHIASVKLYLAAAGVPASVISSDTAAGCITRGVADLWTYEPGGAKWSPFFEQSLIQLTMMSEEDEDDEESEDDDV